MEGGWSICIICLATGMLLDNRLIMKLLFVATVGYLSMFVLIYGQE